MKIIEGTVASVPPQGGRKHPHQEFIQIDTSNILFICGGAFDGLEKIIESRIGKKSIGFGADVFETGHSSTSISAAIGMAKANELNGKDGTIVAVIGDGSSFVLENLGTIHDLCLDHVSVTGDQNTAAVCAYNGGTLENLTVAGSIEAKDFAAGIFAASLPMKNSSLPSTTPTARGEDLRAATIVSGLRRSITAIA